MSDWRIERLDREHLRDEFSCGKPPLDEFIRRLVTQYEKRNLGRTYVACEAGEKRLVGYHTLASEAVSFEHLPMGSAKKLPRHPVPTILLARLAVNQSVQGRRLGETLLIDALRRSLTPSKSTPSTKKRHAFMRNTASSRCSTTLLSYSCPAQRSKM